jgi:hypothetical protein
MTTMRWYDCGFCVVCAEDRQTAARLGRVPMAAVRGPYSSPDAARRARTLRDAVATGARGRHGPSPEHEPSDHP